MFHHLNLTLAFARVEPSVKALGFFLCWPLSLTIRVMTSPFASRFHSPYNTPCLRFFVCSNCILRTTLSRRRIRPLTLIRSPTLMFGYPSTLASSITQSQSPPPTSHTLFSCPIFYTAAVDVVVFTWFHESVYPWHTLSLSLPRFLITACCDVRVC